MRPLSASYQLFKGRSVCVCVGGGTSDGLKRSDRMNQGVGGPGEGPQEGEEGGGEEVLLPLWSEPIWGPGASFTW